MEGQTNTYQDFECDTCDESNIDWLEPPSPFAAVLSKAFGQRLKASGFNPDAPQ